MNFLIVCLLLLLNSQVFSQEGGYRRIDFEALRSSVRGSTSSIDYTEAFKRFQQGDTTLSIDEIRFLYCGYMFQPSFDPFWRPDRHKALDEVLSKDMLSESDCDTIIKYASRSISSMPFDVKHLRLLGYAYDLKGNEKEAMRYGFMSSAILGAILSTGDGKSCKTGWQVIAVSHEYHILGFFDMRSASQALSEDLCDIINLEEPRSDVSRVYFDVSHLLTMQENLFKRR